MKKKGKKSQEEWTIFKSACCEKEIKIIRKKDMVALMCSKCGEFLHMGEFVYLKFYM
jgi:hypothetical protein